MSERFDVHKAVTDQIVAAIEAGASGEGFKLPWHCAGGPLHRPVNARTGSAYRGVNTVSLWMAAHGRGYSHQLWATYKQWQELGAQVRKGERASLVVFWKELPAKASADDAETEGESEAAPRKRLFARASYAFNVAQVDGYDVEEPQGPGFEPDERCDALLKASGADIREGGARAYYAPGEDYIQLPARSAFVGTATSSPREAYYSTAFHELTHWTGHQSRLARDMSGRFKTEAYAAEELVAELGAAFLCADTGICPAPREDHAQYLAGWLKILKGDSRAIFTAASAADKAARFLLDKLPN